jgi:hypothetical protein
MDVRRKKHAGLKNTIINRLSAHNRYRHDLSASREGINLTSEQLSELDE